MPFRSAPTSSVLIFTFTLLLLSPPVLSMEKETFYAAIEALCIPKEEFNLLYKPYSTSSAFLWDDFYQARTSTDNKMTVRVGQTYPLVAKSYRPYHRDWSMIEGMQFARDHYYGVAFSPMVPTVKTFLDHPEGRDFLPFSDGCAIERNTGYNWMYYNRENLVPISTSNMNKGNLRNFSHEVVSMGYQLSRGLLYLFENNHHFVKLDKDRIFFKDVRGMNHYKMKDVYNVR